MLIHGSTRRLTQIAASAAFALLASSPVAAKDLFTSGNWKGSSYSNESGDFTHCAMSATYVDGTALLFSINRDLGFNMGFTNPAWQLPQDGTYPLVIKIDSIHERKLNAKAVMPSMVLVEIDSPVPTFQAIRAGRQMKVFTMSTTMPFSLDGTSRALARLFDCVEREKAMARGPQGSNPFSGPQQNTNPFSDSPPAQSGTPQGSPPADGQEMIAGAVGRSGIGAKMMSEEQRKKQLPAWASAWSGEGYVGGFQAIPVGVAKTVEEVTAAMISSDSQVCTGQFASGALEPEVREGKTVRRFFTSCDGDAFDGYVRYTAIADPSGSFQVVATMGTADNRTRIDAADRGVIDALLPGAEAPSRRPPVADGADGGERSRSF